MLLTDKIAVIAGDAYGIGLATAQLFMREGARVLLIDDLAGKPQDTRLRAGAWAMPYVHADVTQVADVQRAVAACEKLYDQVHVLFNVAGRSPIRQSFENCTEQTWSEMLARNLNSVYWCSKYFLPLMKRAAATTEGAIINHASIDAILGNPGIAAYSAAKGGVLPLTHVMAHDLAKYRIRVNSVATGGIRYLERPVSKQEKTRLAVTPAARMGTADDVAKVALFLASDMASYVNGANIVVDGGRTATTHGCYND
ncbi:MAG: SDR family oxidoreductase [Betaproteobacteria bacterium]|nr:SDR family oxidoreductase [Betaproteobacteria bacterium]